MLKELESQIADIAILAMKRKIYGSLSPQLCHYTTGVVKLAISHIKRAHGVLQPPAKIAPGGAGIAA